jgi:adenine C2-methylase RlmN of 23S rRNA A2503 and tRNA A37
MKNKEYISKSDLEQKVRSFAERETTLLSCLSDLHFEDSLMRLPIETKDRNVFETTFCYGYQHEKYLLAMSSQVGCATKCNFCDLGDFGFKRDLTDEEILDQLAILLDRAMKRGYDIFDRPMKATFVMGGEPLANRYFSKALDSVRQHIPLQTKISTIFPANKKSWNTYKEVVEIAKDYPNIVQFQVSLNSTDEQYKQDAVRIPLADFKKIREAGELWADTVPNPRKIDLTFTLNKDTPMDPSAIKDILSPELFAIRLRDWVPTKRGNEHGLKQAEYTSIEDMKSCFEDCGYFFVPGFSGHVEQRFRLSPGETVRMYNTIRNWDS